MFIFKIPESQKLEIKVKIPASAQAKPSKSEQCFTAEVKYLSHADKQEMRELLPTWGKDGDEILASKLMIGWDGIKDQEGEILEFNENNLKAMMNIPWVRIAILSAIFEYLYNAKVAEDVAKNF